MNILIDFHMIGDKSGGNETHYRGILDQFVKSDTSNFNFFLYFSNKHEMEKYSSVLPKNFKLALFKSRNPIFKYLFEIPSLIKHHNIDILHTQYFLPITKKCIYVTTIHDLSFEYFPSHYSFFKLVVNRIWIKFAARISDKIFTVSEFTKQDIIQRYKINKDKISVIYNAPKAIFLNQMNNDLVLSVRTKFNINSPFILSVGNLQPRKNIPRLIKAYILLRENNPSFNYKLFIVGKKEWKSDSTFLLANSSKFTDDIILTGYVTDHELYVLYKSSIIFVYPSLFEGFGLPVIEAMACGTPVITSNVTSLPEIVQDAAMLVNPRDVFSIYTGIKALLEDYSLMESLKTKGYLQAMKFEWAKTCKIILDVYLDVIKSKTI